MDSRISIGDKLELEKIETRLSVNPDKKPDKYISQILDEAPNDRMYAAMPMRSGTVVPLNLGQRFKATFYTNTGLICCEIAVTGRYRKGGFFLTEIELVTPLEKVQRRQFFRLECRKPIKYRIVEGEEFEKVRAGEKYCVDDRGLVWKDAIMIDLSGGGIRFVSAYQEKKDSFVEVQFDIEYNEQVEVIYTYAELLRSERNINNNSIFDQRIMFWKIENREREKIIQYIFGEQRKRRSQQ